jgi:hypothetical protein
MNHLDPDLQHLGDALRASTTIDLAREEPAGFSSDTGRSRPASATARRRAPRRVLAGGTLGLAAGGAALVLALSGSSPTPAFAVTRQDNGSVLVKLNYLNPNERTLDQVNDKLTAMGINEEIMVQGAAGPAAVSGPVTCQPAPGQSNLPTTVRVLEGTNGTEVIGAGQSAGNTAEGTFHISACYAAATDSADSGNTGAFAGVTTANQLLTATPIPAKPGTTMVPVG